MDWQEHMRQQIRRQRERLGMTQVDAAAQAGMDRSEYAHMENGTKRAGLGRLFQVAERLGLNVRIVCRPSGAKCHT